MTSLVYAGDRKKRTTQWVVLPSPKGNPPVNTVLPVITGSLAVGNNVSTSLGSWTNNPGTFYVQWQRDRQDIRGANSASYVIQNADLGHTIQALVTAWNNDGSGYAISLGLSNTPGTAGQFDFSNLINSGLLIILEDI